MLPHPGDMFAGKYRIDSVLGKGSFSHVYKAMVDEVDRAVAIKVLKPVYNEQGVPSYSPQLEARFLREAKLLSELQDPHTIRLYDYGRSDGGLLFMIFEFIDGRDLAEVLLEGRLNPDRAVHILTQVLESLREAHLHGIVHRDIKPANILIYTYLGDPDRAKLLDFGVAKDLDAALQLTTRNMRIGTMRYMSPEQVRGDIVTPASDIYALGLVLYEMLVGCKAIETDDMNLVSLFHLRPDRIPIPANVVMPLGLRMALARMIAKAPDARFADASAALNAILAIDMSPGLAVDDEDPPTLPGFDVDGPTLRGPRYEE